MNSVLAKYGNFPVSATALALEFPEIRKPGQKLGLLERNGDIIRLKRGLYVCSKKVSGKTISLELVANRLLTPSYVSMSTALRYYGFIPEAVYVTQSMTTKEPREYETPIGRFLFTHIKKRSFLHWHTQCWRERIFLPDCIAGKGPVRFDCPDSVTLFALS